MKRLEPVKKILAVPAAVLLLAVMAGCSTSVQLESVKGDDIAKKPLSLEEDVLFSLLAGEFAGVRGQLDKSVDYYNRAARQTNDLGIVRRAAHIALFAGRYDDVLIMAERWQALGADEQELARLKLLAYLHKDNVKASLLEIDKLLIQEGKLDELAVVSLGHILSREASAKTALEILKRLNKQYPKQPRLLMLQAGYEANFKQYEAALALMNQVLVLEPNLADAYQIKAQILMGLGKQQLAAEAMAQAVDKRPEDTRLRLRYARMLIQMKQFESAWAEFIQLDKEQPDNESILLSLGLLAIEIDNKPEAIKYLQKIVDQGTRNPQVFYYLGRIRQNDGDLAEAIKLYEQVTAGEFVLDASIRVASLLAEAGQVDAGLAKLQALLSMVQNDQGQIRIYLAQGEVLRSVNRQQDAMAIYDLALKVAPDNTDLLYARALTAEKLDMLERAEADLRKVLKSEPDNANALNALGYTLADRTQRYEEAKKYILKAAQLLPDDPAILDSLGWVYYRLGEYQTAIKWLRKAFAHLEDAEIAAHLGEVLWVSGQHQEAQKIWQRGLKLNSQHSVLLNTIKRYKP
ncbi:MAG: tetratricopeptide repeat protein [Gammaproteobacteria bacterium]|nr:tetratricopeptide repeat protein [Gammaproteobacteria bacterium]